MQHPEAECPPWDYDKLPSRQKILAEQANGVIEDVRAGRFDLLAMLADSRSVHDRLFSKLAPKGREYLAGHYRGERFKCLQFYRVGIRSNPMVGVEPRLVRTELSKFQQLAESAISRIDSIHKMRESDLPGEQKLLLTVQVGCRLFAEFLRIHPYADGNGHVGRVMLLAILARYRYFPVRFPLEPRPADPSYSESIKAYQQGRRQPLEELVLRCVKDGRTKFPLHS
ncbi:MAG TPA: Fic family protein [Tepidisphaeraceae bacterium]|nr:Fic family protein [Tepidisphaeraceae bacterium]